MHYYDALRMNLRKPPDEDIDLRANGLSQLDFVFGKYRLIHNNVERSINETDKLFAIMQGERE